MKSQQILVFPEGLAKIPTAVITQRMINLIGAWHSQILEMMGAMGIREARRCGENPAGRYSLKKLIETLSVNYFQNKIKL